MRNKLWGKDQEFCSSHIKVQVFIRYLSEDIKVGSWYKSLEFGKRKKPGLELYI